MPPHQTDDPAELSERFVQDGFVVLREAFPREVAAECRDILWRDTGCDPHDPATWTRPVVRLGGYAQEPFRRAATMPRLHAAFDTLVGPGRWEPLQGLGTVPVRFPHPDPPGDDGWHIEGSYTRDGESWPPYVNVRSSGRTLLLLFLFSDVSEDDAPTRIRVGSHLAAPARLRPAGEEGLSFLDVAGTGLFDATADLPQALATGRAGDVFVCHPFLVHAAQPHRGTEPRFMAQPPLYPAPGQPIRLEREDGDYSPVERAIRRGLAAAEPAS
ncbi:phytanoyl-CoA dioxygenase family protein [Streptomyces sparsogenes]|uniref:phytanoyl-CoA dioxygenase family protein n=1 Tax=Streptomyces sparsogenes TaxID=67365 RepID=UPI00340A821B